MYLVPKNELENMKERISKEQIRENKSSIPGKCNGTVINQLNQTKVLDGGMQKIFSSCDKASTSDEVNKSVIDESFQASSFLDDGKDDGKVYSEENEPQTNNKGEESRTAEKNENVRIFSEKEEDGTENYDKDENSNEKKESSDKNEVEVSNKVDENTLKNTIEDDEVFLTKPVTDENQDITSLNTDKTLKDDNLVDSEQQTNIEPIDNLTTSEADINVLPSTSNKPSEKYEIWKDRHRHKKTSENREKLEKDSTMSPIEKQKEEQEMDDLEESTYTIPARKYNRKAKKKVSVSKKAKSLPYSSSRTRMGASLLTNHKLVSTTKLPDSNSKVESAEITKGNKNMENKVNEHNENNSYTSDVKPKLRSDPKRLQKSRVPVKVPINVDIIQDAYKSKRKRDKLTDADDFSETIIKDLLDPKRIKLKPSRRQRQKVSNTNIIPDTDAVMTNPTVKRQSTDKEREYDNKIIEDLLDPKRLKLREKNMQYPMWYE